MTRRLQLTFRPSTGCINPVVAVQWLTPILVSRLTANDQDKGKSRPYLLSSEDRSDVSIDAQRRELAAERCLAIVTEFTDVVESGKDENRAGFQELIAALRSREWSTVLLLDTSRLARRRHLPALFEHEAERRGVKVLYRTVPEADPITEMLLRSILQNPRPRLRRPHHQLAMTR